MKFGQLKSGDVVTLAGHQSVILAIENPHPLHPNFILVVWYIFSNQRTSFDMLHPDYELITGSVVTRDGMVSYRRALAEMQNS